MAKKPAKRDPIAMDLLTNGLYRKKVEKDRKKEEKRDPKWNIEE